MSETDFPTPRARPVAPGALEAALKATRAYVRQYPKHAQWILDGHPGMTHQEHYDRFGKAFRKGDLS